MKKKLLVIEEDPDIRDLVSFILSDAGYEVIVANAEIDQLQNYHPDLIILDERLKNNEDHLLCKKLKDFPGVKRIPIIVFSTESKIEKLAKICDAKDYLSKPFDIEDLLLKVKQVFS